MVHFKQLESQGASCLSFNLVKTAVACVRIAPAACQHDNCSDIQQKDGGQLQYLKMGLPDKPVDPSNSVLIETLSRPL